LSGVTVKAQSAQKKSFFQKVLSKNFFEKFSKFSCRPTARAPADRARAGRPGARRPVDTKNIF
jgi:hypothetical protein